MRFFTFIVVVILGCTHPLLAQRKSKLNTNGQGTLFAQVGYNRSAYTSSDVQFKGNSYSFYLRGTEIKDNEEAKGMNEFFSSSSPQISIKLGYFIKPKWALTLSFDRYNTFFKENQGVTLDGTIAPGTHSDYSGNYTEVINLKRSQFDIAQHSGVNSISFGVQRNDILYKSKKAEFALHAVYGLKLGALLTTVDYTFDNYTTQNITSLCGIGASAEIGVRFEFYQHVFLQAGLNGGVLNQNNIKLSSNGSTIGKQVVGYISPSVNLGFSLFVRPKNNCGTCPKW
ncbi:MAG TPA: hypothetical protein VFD77_03185 [Brumimicrobium sp.]|nr:hypothetical protein [Brumimicrobium sp.]